jgi:hypothetical protein
MTTTYNSFVIRSWRLDDQESRIVIEHIQTGEQCRVRTLSAALEWISQWAEGQARQTLMPRPRSAGQGPESSQAEPQSAQESTHLE